MFFGGVVFRKGDICLGEGNSPRMELSTKRPFQIFPNKLKIVNGSLSFFMENKRKILSNKRLGPGFHDFRNALMGHGPKSDGNY